MGSSGSSLSPNAVRKMARAGVHAAVAIREREGRIPTKIRKDVRFLVMALDDLIVSRDATPAERAKARRAGYRHAPAVQRAADAVFAFSRRAR